VEGPSNEGQDRTSFASSSRRYSATLGEDDVELAVPPSADSTPSPTPRGGSRRKQKTFTLSTEEVAERPEHETNAVFNENKDEVIMSFKGTVLPPVTYAQQEGVITPHAIKATLQHEFTPPPKRDDEEDTAYEERVAAARVSDAIEHANLVQKVHERVAAKDLGALELLGQTIQPTAAIRHTPLQKKEKILFSLPCVGFLGGPEHMEGKLGRGNLMLTEVLPNESVDGKGKPEPSRYRMHYLVQSPSAKFNYKENVKRDTQTFSSKDSSATKEVDEVLALYRNEHEMHGLYTIMNVDGEYFHAHSEWVGTAKLSSLFDAKKVTERKEQVVRDGGKGCCYQCLLSCWKIFCCGCACCACCICRCTCFHFLNCTCFECVEPPEITSFSVSHKTSTRHGRGELVAELEQYLQTLTYEKKEGVPCPSNLDVERDVTGSEIKQTLQRSLNTLHMVCRDPASVWRSKPALKTIVAVLEPDVPITEAMLATSALQMLIPRGPLWARDVESGGLSTAYPGWSSNRKASFFGSSAQDDMSDSNTIQGKQKRCYIYLIIGAIVVILILIVIVIAASS